VLAYAFNSIRQVTWIQVFISCSIQVMLLALKIKLSYTINTIESLEDHTYKRIRKHGINKTSNF
jgi:hypothetical protein